MKKNLIRIVALLLAAIMLLGLVVTVFAEENSGEVTILFTHDLHSHLLPANDENGESYGGYARLMTAIKAEKEKTPDALLVDAGDFSMGSLFQTAYPTSAIELRMMGAMGYDTVSLGNHEFDYLPTGFASMLNAAVASGETVPPLVNGNYVLPEEGSELYTAVTAEVKAAMENYGITPYRILEKGGFYYVVFGLVGEDSDACAPNSGMILQDPAVVAQEIVNTATAECVAMYGQEPIVIALSHCGTSGGEGEDYELAGKVTGIDLIISAHSHTILYQPIQVNDTWIVSAGEYGKFLGVAHMDMTENGNAVLKDYKLVPIDDTIPEDAEIAALVEGYKADVEAQYLSKYGMTFDQVLLNNTYAFDTVDQVYAYAHESTLGNVFSDAYHWAVEKATGENVDVALTASGVVRESIPVGNVTVSDIFNAASLGVGTEGELLAIYLTGKDLKVALEVDASVYPLMHSAQLFMSGVEYSFNTNRMLFNKVDYAMLRTDDGTALIEDDKLYRVVCGMYMGQMLGSVEETSFGLVSIVPRNAQGEPVAVSELVNYVVRDENGVPLKEWYAIASYLDQMGDTMYPHYEQTDGRKVVYSSLNPVKLLRNANKFTYILLAVVLLLLTAVYFIVRGVTKLIRRKRK